MWAIIAGGREITDYEVVETAIRESGWLDEITKVICGKARGVDTVGAEWATNNGIPVEKFISDTLDKIANKDLI